MASSFVLALVLPLLAAAADGGPAADDVGATAAPSAHATTTAPDAQPKMDEASGAPAVATAPPTAAPPTAAPPTAAPPIAAPPTAAPPTAAPPIAAPRATPKKVEKPPASFQFKFPARRHYVGKKGAKGITLQAVDAEGKPTKWNGSVEITGTKTSDGEPLRLTTDSTGKATIPPSTLSHPKLVATGGGVTGEGALPDIAGWLTLLPAVLAIALALWLKEVVFALLGGIYLGVALLHGSLLAAFPRSLDLMIGVVADADKIKVIVFTLAMGGLVGLVSAAGGTQGIVKVVSRFAKDARTTSIATWLMGMVIFFDDYASTLLVGNTIRPLSDRYRISREKLAYLVDSTAATITSLALVSTWIGYEVSTLGAAMTDANIEGDAYRAFLAGLPSRFYPILALLFVGMIAFSRRDFGPMAKAELRARTTGKLLRDGAAPLVDDEVAHDADALSQVTPRAWFAAVAIGGLILSVVLALVILGPNASYDALLYGSGLSLLGAVAVAVASRALTLNRALEATVRGLRSMALAVLVLMLAWSVGKVMSNLAAGHYVASLLSDTLPAWSLPTITFVLAALMALATGTSWGTMAILFPVVVPLVATHTTNASDAIFLATTSAVLAGAVFGDHCSPISDTTVLSSVASASDHVDHTKTQMPYALVVGSVSIVFGTIPAGLGVSPWICLGLGIAALVAVLKFVGREIPEATATARGES